MTIEDNSVLGGFGSAVLQMLNSRGLHIPVKILGYSDAFIGHGSQAVLWGNAGINAEGIAAALSLFHK